MYIRYSIEVSLSLPTAPLYFFPNLQFLTLFGDIVPMKHGINTKLKLVRESYFFLNRKLQYNFISSSYKQEF